LFKEASMQNREGIATTDTLEAVCARLTLRQSDLEAEVERKLAEVRAEHVGFDSSNSTDGGDAAQIDATSSVNHAEISRDMAELRDIGTALARISGGSYGECITCGEPIEPGRLAALPAAERCSHCQTAFEQARPRTHSL
jgi:RNA polymerase-binding transcription factor DksA